MKFLNFLLLCLILGLTISANAQTKSKTILSGVVMDSIGSIVPNVQITAQNKNGKRFEAVTNKDGNYNLTLPEGIYTIQIIRSPFKTFIIKEYQVAYRVEKMQLDVSLICEKCEELIEHPSALSQKRVINALFDVMKTRLTRAVRYLKLIIS